MVMPHLSQRLNEIHIRRVEMFSRLWKAAKLQVEVPGKEVSDLSVYSVRSVVVLTTYSIVNA